MSRCPTVRAKQRKNPLLPVDSLAFTVRRVAALPAAHPAEVMASPGVGAAVSSRTPRGEAASPARVLPVAADFPRTPQGVAALPARVLLAAEVLVVALAILTAALAALVQKRIPLAVAARSGEGPAAHPEALVSAVHSPKPLRKWKFSVRCSRNRDAANKWKAWDGNFRLSTRRSRNGDPQHTASSCHRTPAQQECAPDNRCAHIRGAELQPGTAGTAPGPREGQAPDERRRLRLPPRHSRNGEASIYQIVQWQYAWLSARYSRNTQYPETARLRTPAQQECAPGYSRVSVWGAELQPGTAGTTPGLQEGQAPGEERRLRSPPRHGRNCARLPHTPSPEAGRRTIETEAHTTDQTGGRSHKCIAQKAHLFCPR